LPAGADGDETGGDIEPPPQPARNSPAESTSHRPAHRFPRAGLVFGLDRLAVLDALPVVRTVIEKAAGLPGVAVAAEDEGLQLALTSGNSATQTA